MSKKMNIVLLPVLVFCIVLMSAFIPAIAESSSDESVVFSGVEAAYKVVVDSDKHKYFNVLNGVSAVLDDASLTIKVENVTKVVPSKIISEEGEFYYNEIYDDVELNGGSLEVKYGVIGEGTIFWITYGAYESDSDTEPIATVKRPVIVTDADWTPYIYAVSDSDDKGTTAAPGENITYEMTFCNSSKNQYAYEDDTFNVVAPIPDGMGFVTATEGYTLTQDGIEWAVPISIGETKSVSFTLLVTEEIAGTAISYKAWYGSQMEYEEYGDCYLNYTNHCMEEELASIVTEISGTALERGYRVIYDANGGENPPIDEKRYIAGDKVSLKTKGNISSYGYDFLGWSILSTATSALWTDSALEGGTASKYTVIEDLFSDEIVFYAVWRRDPSIVVLGDIDDDARLDARDLLAMRELLLGLSDVKGISDVNKDGVTDIKDLIALKKLFVD